MEGWEFLLLAVLVGGIILTKIASASKARKKNEEEYAILMIQHTKARKMAEYYVGKCVNDEQFIIGEMNQKSGLSYKKCKKLYYRVKKEYSILDE